MGLSIAIYDYKRVQYHLKHCMTGCEHQMAVGFHSSDFGGGYYFKGLEDSPDVFDQDGSSLDDQDGSMLPVADNLLGTNLWIQKDSEVHTLSHAKWQSCQICCHCHVWLPCCVFQFSKAHQPFPAHVQ